MSTTIAVIGWLSAAILLSAYALVSMRKLESDGATYQVLNIVGSVGLATNSAAMGAWPSVVTNLIWIAIGLVAFARIIPSLLRGWHLRGLAGIRRGSDRSSA
ncbi:CBU_0592 family membrane protein [Pendulispora albinea]|uniref:CBU-0592-like domain-containing protein n=1 Tax=Pendulispora albinea TaxID=2741071 RepID=A0ABZ2M3A5_9BACT